MAERVDPSKWHGWVHPLPSGAKARCGGPGLCRQCAQELTEKKAEMTMEIINGARHWGATNSDIVALLGIRRG